MIVDRFALRSLFIADLLALWIALLIATYATGPALEGVRFLRLLEWRFSLGNILLLIILSGSWLFLAFLFSDESTGRRVRWQPVAWLTLSGTTLLTLAALLFSLHLITPTFLLFFASLHFFLDWGLRALHLRLLAFLDPEQQHRIHTIVIGNHPTVQPFIEALRGSPRHKLLEHFCPDNATDTSARGGQPCDIAKLTHYLEKSIVDQIVIALPLAEISPALREIIQEAQQQGIEVVVALSLLADALPLPEPLGPRSHLVRITLPGAAAGILPLFSFDSGPQMGWTLLMKRAIDFGGAFLAMILLAPLMVAIALAIRITMGSPILFTQPRMGYHRRIFRLYKFRTMIPDADAMREALRIQNDRDGAAFKMRYDPRVTPVGRWLRKLNLDELPQLFNVLKGEMSLVGPRPLPLDDYAHMDRKTYLRRLSVLPGITCTWQISNRSKVTFSEWMQMDLDYIDHWSIKLDLALLVKTVWVVLRGRGDE